MRNGDSILGKGHKEPQKGGTAVSLEKAVSRPSGDEITFHTCCRGGIPRKVKLCWSVKCKGWVAGTGEQKPGHGRE